MAENKQGTNGTNKKPDGFKPSDGKRKETTFEKVVKGAGHAVKTAGGIVSAVKGIIDLINMIKQHPEWYTHYDTSNLIAMNLAAKQHRVYPEFEMGAQNGSERQSIPMPSVAEVDIQLTTPHGDEDGWRTGIRLLYQQLRTANSGRINYRVQDLEKYVQNVRALHAIDAFLCRLYRMTYTFRSTNSAIPRLLIEACGIDFDDIMTNAADLLMYVQRFSQQVSISFPLNIDYYARTHWLFGNVFVDSNSHKPSFYVTNFFRNQSENTTSTGVIYYESDGNTPHPTWRQNKVFNSFGSGEYGFYTYSELVAECQRIKNSLLDDQIMSVIAGDIIKTFGDRAFIEPIIPKIDDGIVAIFDDYIMNQFQNSTVTGVQTSGALDVQDSLGATTIYSEDIGDSGSDWIESKLSALAGLGVPVTFLAKMRDQINRMLINWSDNKISTGEIMSITRLVASGIQDNPTTADGIIYGIFGTETVAKVVALSYPGGADSQIGGTLKLIPIAGVTVSNGSTAQNGLSMAMWSNFDYCPRMFMSDSTLLEEMNKLSPPILDWDVFALVNKDWFANYFSYGNQSLLYSGSSQDQSSTKVYRKTSNKKPKDKKEDAANKEKEKKDAGTDVLPPDKK